jgi:hypothetical protein
MRVKIPNEEDGFRVSSCEFCGVKGKIIIPGLDAKWNKNNLFYRSLIVDEEGSVLSSGWPKFFNQNEKPDCYPSPEIYKDWCIQEKLDGSLLIADYVNGQFNMRTRGTASYVTQENASDFEQLRKKYPNVVSFLQHNSHISLLFEIVTPNNVIVIRPKEIEFYLIGAINKIGMNVISSSDLTEIWRLIGCPPVPRVYQIEQLQKISVVAEMVKSWKNAEGVVISYNNNQNRIKLKSDWYCWLHRIKSQLSSESNLIEYYVQNSMPVYEVFYEKIKAEFDFEIAEQLKDTLIKITKAGEQVNKVIEDMKDFVHSIRKIETRKQQAEFITTAYKNTNRTQFVFCILDGKEFSNSQYIKLLEQFLT